MIACIEFTRPQDRSEHDWRLAKDVMPHELKYYINLPGRQLMGSHCLDCPLPGLQIEFSGSLPNSFSCDKKFCCCSRSHSLGKNTEVGRPKQLIPGSWNPLCPGILPYMPILIGGPIDDLQEYKAYMLSNHGYFRIFVLSLSSTAFATRDMAWSQCQTRSCLVALQIAILQSNIKSWVQMLMSWTNITFSHSSREAMLCWDVPMQENTDYVS